jgi:hypothetical protein
MHILKILAAVALGGSASAQAHGQDSQNPKGTVQGFYEFCTSKEWMLRSVCEYFIMGVGDVMGAQGLGYRTAPADVRVYLQKTSLCTGTDNYVPPTGAMVQAFINWAQKHPEKWDYAGVVGVSFALSETWPCRK